MSKLTAAAAAIDRDLPQQTNHAQNRLSKYSEKPPDSYQAATSIGGSSASQTPSGSQALLVVDQLQEVKSPAGQTNLKQTTGLQPVKSTSSVQSASRPTRSIKSQTSGQQNNRTQLQRAPVADTDPHGSSRVIYLLLGASVLVFVVLITVLILIKKPKGSEKPP